MAPRGRKRKSGQMRADAARDHMRVYGFQESVINESIKELLGVYGEDQWFFIEDGSYASLLSTCLEKQEAIENQLDGNQNDEMAEALNEEMADEEQPNPLAVEEQANQLVGEEEEEEKEQEQVQDMHVEDGRDQADELPITNEAVTDPSPADFDLGDFAPTSVEGVENRHCGWLSSEEEEETDPKEDSDGDDDDDDDEMIQLTPEPLCEELEELLREVRGQTKRKKETKWDK